MLYLAIDQHRKQLTVNLRNTSGDVILKRQVSTQWERVRAFLEEVRRRSQPEGGVVTILEVCGFNDWLLKLLAEYGCRETILVQPEKRSKKKTDRRDADQLGEILWVNRERLLAGKKVQGLRRVHPPTRQCAEDRQVTWMRKRLGTQRTRTINKIKHILRKHNLEQECPTKGIDTIKAKKWLIQVFLPPVDRLEMDQLFVSWKLWDEQIDRVDIEIAKRQPKSETAAILATIPGCAAYGSLALACRIDPVTRFARPGSLPNYWGLTPRCRNSGEVTDRLGSITKEGSAMARFILGQVVVHVLRRDPWMKGWYGKIKRRRGAKIARVAVMRRLAVISQQMLKNREPYVIGGPRARKRAAQPAPIPEDMGSQAVRQAEKSGNAWGSAPDPGIFGGIAPVSKGRRKRTAPSSVGRQGPDAPLAHRRPSYSSPGCFPAEPDSASPGKRIIEAK